MTRRNQPTAITKAGDASPTALATVCPALKTIKK
jgi:hypothetical protein